MRKNFSDSYPQFGHAPSKTVAISVLGRKSLKNIGLKARQIISQSGAPTHLAPVLTTQLYCVHFLPVELASFETYRFPSSEPVRGSTTRAQMADRATATVSSYAGKSAQQGNKSQRAPLYASR
jgi:hypothetical protein